MKDRIIIGTRRSRLALTQTEMVSEALRAAFPGLVIERREIVTEGDRDRRTPLAQAESPGIFTREIETRLLAGEIDLAVHSFKDLPTELPDGLMIAATPKRADPRDALVLASSSLVGADPCVRPASSRLQRNTGAHAGAPLHKLKQGAIVGTSSPRRSAQLLAIRADLVIKDLRGNIDTRLAKLARGDYDAIVVAKAALDRLNVAHPPSGVSAVVDVAQPPSAAVVDAHPRAGVLHQQESHPGAGVPHIDVLDPGVVLPAPAQGALAVECREGDAEVARLAGAISDAATFVAASAERELLARLGGGCHLALGALAEVAGERLRLRAVVMSRDGRRAARAEAVGRVDDPSRVIEDCRRQLIDAGAEELLT